MMLMATLRLALPEIVLLALGAAWAVGLTSDVVATVGMLALIVAVGIAGEELIYRYERQGRHGPRHS
jgi:hypothetical protein